MTGLPTDRPDEALRNVIVPKLYGTAPGYAFGGASASRRKAAARP